MVDVRKPATLRGFPVSVADVGDQMHLFHPLLSFEGDPALYLAHRLDWRNDPEALAIADPNEASALGTLLPPACARPIASGEGLVALGAGLVQAAAAAEVELLDSEIAFARVDGPECWIGVATPALYTALRTRLAEDARAVFDEALEDAVHLGSRLSERGDAALLLMRKCGSLRRDDLAIRQLAGARQNGEFDLYRRLLIRFALELETQEGILDDRVKRHIAAVRQTVISTFADDSRFGLLLDLIRKRSFPDEALERPYGEMYSKTIGGGLVSASNMQVQDRKNYSGGVKEWTLITDHKVRFLDTVLERKAGQHTQRPPRMAFKLPKNQKANPGFPIEEGSGKKFAELSYGRFKKLPVGAVMIFSIRSNSMNYEKIRSLDLDFEKSPYSEQRRKTIAEDQRGFV